MVAVANERTCSVWPILNNLLWAELYLEPFSQLLSVPVHAG